VTDLRRSGLQRLHGPAENLQLALSELRTCCLSAVTGRLDCVGHGYGGGECKWSEMAVGWDRECLNDAERNDEIWWGISGTYVAQGHAGRADEMRVKVSARKCYQVAVYVRRFLLHLPLVAQNG